MYECHAKKHGNYKLVFTEPLAARRIESFNDYVSVEQFPSAIVDADIVIIAIPSYAIESFLVHNFSLLKEGSILVDLTNASQDKKDLKKTLDELHITYYDRWVKAFNDTGAIQELQVSTRRVYRTLNVGGPLALIIMNMNITHNYRTMPTLLSICSMKSQASVSS
jgi:predicted dinucleotide-binding enzyme